MEFHIFASDRTPNFQLEIPGEDCRIEFCSIFAAARHARKHRGGTNATVVIHDQSTKTVNRIPLYESL
jgi:hypothetical protein